MEREPAACRSPRPSSEDGEDAFRAREAEVVGSLLEQADGGAIALGGGSVLSERVREALGRHVVVWLQVDASEAWRRIARSDRPLASSAEGVAELLRGAPAALRVARRRDPAAGRARPDRPRDALAAGAGRAAAPGREDALGRERLGRVPGLRRPRCCSALEPVAAAGTALLRHRQRRRGALRRAARAARSAGSRSSRASRRRRWPRPSGCCASWPAPG